MRKLLSTHLCLIFFLFAGAQPDEGLVAKYTFNNGDAADKGSNTARIYNGVLSPDRFGNADCAWHLQGNYNSFINLGTGAVLKPVNGTISMWVNVDNAVAKGRGTPYNPFIITKSNGGDDFFEGYFIGYGLDFHKVNANVSTDSIEGINISSQDTLSLNHWHQVALAYNDQYLWLYVDGVLQNDNRPIAKNFRSHFLKGDSVIVGSFANEKNKRCLSAAVDDIYIYDRVLKPEEIRTLFEVPNPNKYHFYWLWFFRVLSVVACFFILIWALVKRYKRVLDQEKVNNNKLLKLIEMEAKAIRTQLTPHFMLNSLDTLERFISEENARSAYSYLTEFSKLLRKILESGNSESIALKEEIDILKSYLDLERMRNNNFFDYEIRANIVAIDQYSIPALLIQPFVESAIWNSLLNAAGNDFLKLELSILDQKRILCEIAYNGRTLPDKGTQSDDDRSLALDYIAQRLELLGKMMHLRCGYEISHQTGTSGEVPGTCVRIIIPNLN